MDIQVGARIRCNGHLGGPRVGDEAVITRVSPDESFMDLNWDQADQYNRSPAWGVGWILNGTFEIIPPNDWLDKFELI